DVRVAESQGNRKVRVHVDGQVPGQEILVQDVVRIQEADERRVQFGQASANRTALSDVRCQPDIAKPGIVQFGEVLTDRPIGLVGRGVVDNDGLDVADCLVRGG